MEVDGAGQPGGAAGGGGAVAEAVAQLRLRNSRAAQCAVRGAMELPCWQATEELVRVADKPVGKLRGTVGHLLAEAATKTRRIAVLQAAGPPGNQYARRLMGPLHARNAHTATRFFLESMADQGIEASDLECPFDPTRKRPRVPRSHHHLNDRDLRSMLRQRKRARQSGAPATDLADADILRIYKEHEEKARKADPGRSHGSKSKSKSSIRERREVTRLQGAFTSFFGAIHQILLLHPKQRASAHRIKVKLKKWQATDPQAKGLIWLADQDDWTSLVTPALQYLSRPESGLPVVPDFVPLTSQSGKQWEWHTDDHIADHDLEALTDHFLRTYDSSENASIPEPRCRTDYVLKPSTAEEKKAYRLQEKERFAHPERPFTFRQHGYEGAVPPVKGFVINNRVREHSLMTSDRPAFVTLIAIVRDAVARLPNGEGTRGDVCTLVRDSAYLLDKSPTDKLAAAISGALDRLNDGEDPPVLYTNKKWIYLYRNRTENDFPEEVAEAEEAHAKLTAAAAAAEAKSKSAAADKTREGGAAPAAASQDDGEG